MAVPCTLLGIETSCDETAAAIVRCDAHGKGEILAQKVLSQIGDHEPFGGVVPEIAARQHVVHLDRLIKEAILEAKINFEELSGIAATAGPGLLGGVLVGLNTAKAIALAFNKPFFAINHLEAHALTPGLTEGLRPPYLLLLVSGGHTQLLAIEDIGAYRRYGTTIDDALGEAFDKVAKLLGLPYPGGPQIEKIALEGDGAAFDFPKPMIGKPNCHFSFSGLKTAVRMTVNKIGDLSAKQKADIAASFQLAVVGSIKDRLWRAFNQFKAEHEDLKRPTLVIAGGVAANRFIRSQIEDLCNSCGFNISTPPLNMCTDNAAMVAWVGIEKLLHENEDDLGFVARARWPLDPLAEAVQGAGVKA